VGVQEILTRRSSDSDSRRITTNELATSPATSILCERDLGAESNFSGGPRKSVRTSTLPVFSGGPRNSGSSTFFCLVIPRRPPKKSLLSGFDIVDGGSMPSSGISRHFSLNIPIFLDVVFFVPESQESDLTCSFCFSCCPFRSKNPCFSYLIFVLFSSRLFCFPLLLVSTFCFALKLVSFSKELYFFFLSFSNGIELLFMGGALFTLRSASLKLKKLEFSITRGGGRDFFSRPDGLY